jgi:NitT/TauT family transport system permease protein
MKRRQAGIYINARHVFVTLAFVVVPFLFLLVFTRLAGLNTQELFVDVLVSSTRLIIAYLFAVVFAWISAILFFRGKRALIALPLFDVLQSFPTFAAMPLAVYLWGPSSTTIIFFLVLTVIWPIFFSILSSLKLLKRDWEEAARMYGMRGWKYVRHFLFPISLPGLITGSIVGLGEGWEALVATEIITGNPSGLGQFFARYSSNTTITAFGIFGFLVLIFCVNKLIWLPLLEWSHRTMEE